MLAGASPKAPPALQAPKGQRTATRPRSPLPAPDRSRSRPAPPRHAVRRQAFRCRHPSAVGPSSRRPARRATLRGVVGASGRRPWVWLSTTCRAPAAPCACDRTTPSAGRAHHGDAPQRRVQPLLAAGVPRDPHRDSTEDPRTPGTDTVHSRRPTRPPHRYAPRAPVAQ